jgi:hypothetical protein
VTSILFFSFFCAFAFSFSFFTFSFFAFSFAFFSFFFFAFWSWPNKNERGYFVFRFFFLFLVGNNDIMDVDYYSLRASRDCLGAPGWRGCFSYDLFHQAIMHKTAQGMSLDDARDSLKIINGDMRKLKHNGCCIATSIHNLMDAWKAVRDANAANDPNDGGAERP